MEEYKGMNPYENVLDIEQHIAAEEYLKKVTTPGTLEYKLKERFEKMTLCQFLNHVSIKEK
jgi:hypothetical protein